MEPTIVIRAGRERSLQRRHPWVFSGAVETVSGNPEPGATVRVCTSEGLTLGFGAFSQESQIRARMWSFDPDINIDETFIADRVLRSAERRAFLTRTTDACRLVFSEADGLPGVIADRYGDVVVVQLTSAGADRWREVLAEVLLSIPGVRSVFERSDVDARQREGLHNRVGLLRGEVVPDEIIIREAEFHYSVQVEGGHKTGFYLDQRQARAVLGQLATDRRVLNVFSYTGAFSVIAAANGARSVTSVDSSKSALAGHLRNAELNGVEPGEQLEGNAFEVLRRLRDRAASFDLIVLDPPKLAQSAKQADRATRAYKDLNLLGAKLLAPGGMLMTFSCSGGVSADLFQKVIAGAALDAHRDLRIIGHFDQPSDHPVPLTFPEAAYLKGLLLEADSCTNSIKVPNEPFG